MHQLNITSSIIAFRFWNKDKFVCLQWIILFKKLLIRVLGTLQYCKMLIFSLIRFDNESSNLLNSIVQYIGVNCTQSTLKDECTVLSYQQFLRLSFKVSLQYMYSVLYCIYMSDSIQNRHETTRTCRLIFLLIKLNKF